MTKNVLNEKIENLRNCTQRIEGKLPFSLEDLKTNLDLQDIISINIERATQTCVDIAGHVIAAKGQKPPTTMTEAFSKLKDMSLISAEVSESLIKAVGMRNMMVHEYSKVNWSIVHDVCHHHLNTYKEYIKMILKINI